jgi:membrane-associated protein
VGWFESLTEYVSGSAWTYVFLFGISALDVVFPLVPSETSVILGGVLASTGDLNLVLVILSAAAGAILGDNLAYWIGRKTGHRIVNRFFKGERRKQIDWAHRQVQERGGYLIVVGRFIPAGRTAVTLSCGMLEMPWRRFISFDVAAGLVWGTYAAMLGYVGGRTFEENPFYGFLIAFAVALAVTGLVEAYRWLRRRGVLARG